MSALEGLLAAHSRLKARIHAYRLPIHSRAGRFGVGLVYFGTPCLVGYGLFQLTNKARDSNLGPNREILIERQRVWRDEAAGRSASRPRQAAAPDAAADSKRAQ